MAIRLQHPCAFLQLLLDQVSTQSQARPIPTAQSQTRSHLDPVTTTFVLKMPHFRPTVSLIPNVDKMTPPGRTLSKYPSKAESSDQGLTSRYQTHMKNPVRAKKIQSISSLHAMPHKVRSNTLNEIENMENRPAAGDNSRQQSTTADITMMLQTVS
jgi:hypothetical protein